VGAERLCRIGAQVLLLIVFLGAFLCVTDYPPIANHRYAKFRQLQDSVFAIVDKCTSIDTPEVSNREERWLRRYVSRTLLMTFSKS